MLRIFNSARKKLVDTKAVGKYLVYAGGEILLVMIGILLALQVNTWNLNTKNKALEIKYIKGILTEIQGDQNAFRQALSTDSAVLYSINHLLSSIKEKTINDSSYLIHLARTAQGTPLVTQSSVFEDMRSSGRLNLLSSDSIRIQIQSYYSLYDEIDKIIASNNSNALSWFNEYLLDPIDVNSLAKVLVPDIIEVDPFSSSYQTDIKESEFIDRLSVKFLLIKLNQARYNQGLEKAKELESSLTKYLMKIE